MSKKEALCREIYRHVTAYMQLKFKKDAWKITLCRASSTSSYFSCTVQVKTAEGWVVLTGLGQSLNEVTRGIASQYTAIQKEKENEKIILDYFNLKN